MIRQSSINLLRDNWGLNLEHIDRAQKDSAETVVELETRLRDINPRSDTSIVVFGSLARGEFNEKSDIDWTLLIDGAADSNHLTTVLEIGRIVDDVAGKPPGREGVFGNLTFSHELIHLIGGQDDTNSNTTQRNLLLLESKVIGDSAAHKRTIRNILNRYILEDKSYGDHSTDDHVPRFLLNDFARYWRTMAVDFAYKRRSRQQAGAALRNIKLRMSRKLLYVTGLISCFGCELGLCINIENKVCPVENCIRGMEQLISFSPLEILAQTVLKISPERQDVLAGLFESYNDFIGLLQDTEARDILDNLTPDQYAENPVFQDARKNSHRFRDGLDHLFFEVEPLKTLTRKYGVF